MYMQLHVLTYRLTPSHPHHTVSHPHHIKLLLQFLIGIVDAKLLEAVPVEHLKTIDVQHTNEGVLPSTTLKGAVNEIHNPLEEVSIQVLG